MRRHALMQVVAGTLLAAMSAKPRAQATTLPQGFVEEQVGSGWSEVAGITFADDGTMFAWERPGRVWMLHDGHWHKVIDIVQEVGGWRDHGLLGVALHPDFLSNGQVFLLYVVDRHYLLHYGTPQYSATANAYLNATIGRITRYTLDAATEFHTIVPNSRLVLVGETKTTGFPIVHESHGVGSLVFGTDGTLLASCGDGASYTVVDTGGAIGGSYASQALADGILRSKENVGSYRAQLVDCLNGKIIRINPDTGDGVPSNPFYAAGAPRSAKSRVWALGLRNPTRMALRPGTGSSNPANGDPGVLYIGDVGWDDWEELNVCSAAGQNFGWPAFEGMNKHAEFWNATALNRDAPNPLAGDRCPTHFHFRDLIIQDTHNPNPSFPNPCDIDQQVPASLNRFLHHRPAIDWHHSGPARTGIFINGTAATIIVGAQGSPVAGQSFAGTCSIGGAWYTGTQYPEAYRNTWFHADFGNDWIRSFSFDAAEQPTEVRSFATGTSDLVAMAAHPIDGNLYCARWGSITRIRYVPTGNQPPVAVAQVDITWGASPLTVQFSSSGSSDPNSHALTYHWDFGDGTTSSQPNPSHTFNVPSGAPRLFNVLLRVTDPGGLTSTTTVPISVNNSPPTVTIKSPAPGSTYGMGGSTTYALVAEIIDQEHSAEDLECEWQTTLHHNNHAHSEPPENDCAPMAVISPAGCDGNTYFYRIRVTITDAAGLSGSDEVDIHPHCGGNQAPLAIDDAFPVARHGQASAAVLANDADTDGTLRPDRVVIIQPPAHGIANVDGVTGDIAYQHDGSSGSTDLLRYTVNDNDGGTSNIATVAIEVFGAHPGDVNGDHVVNLNDLMLVLEAFGACPLAPATCPADLAPAIPDGQVDHIDLMVVVNNWG